MGANFEELFPDAPRQPFEPIETGRVDSRVSAMRARAQALSPSGQGGENAFDDAFGDLLGAAPAAPAAEGSTEWRDYGKAALGSLGAAGASLAGAGEYAAQQASGEGNTPFEQAMGDLAGTFRRGREASQGFAQDWFSSMTPEAQTRAARNILTLDPNQTIWQGSPMEFLSSVGLKVAQTAAPTVATLGIGALLFRAGMGPSAITYLGASEGVFSLGDVANNIAQEVREAPEVELLQNPQYKALRAQMDEQSAREQFVPIAQGYAPVAAGLAVGGMSAVAGRYLEPVLEGAGGGILSRAGRGFAIEGTQEAAQSSAEQMAQNVAAQVFDSNRSTMAGVPEQAAQGFVVGGAMGGGTAALVGRSPHALPAPQLNQPTAEVTTQNPSTPPAESFESVFGPQAAPAGGYTGAPELPEINSDGQRMMNLGPVDPAIQAALNARRDNLITDMFDGSQPNPMAGPGGTDMQQVWARNEQMNLPQGPPAPGTAVQVAPGQMALPLRTRVRGGAPEPVVPMGSNVQTPDLSAPPETSMERLSQNVMPAGRRPTRADFMRARAEQMRAERYRGTMRDENQIDMFGDPEAPADNQTLAPLVQQLTEAFELTQDPRIQQLLEAAQRPDIKRGQVQALYKSFNEIAGVSHTPTEMRTMPDEPSAEPLSDLKAQLADLADPDSGRDAVYLSRDNMRVLKQQGTFEQVRGVGVPIPNFDLRGGTVIAKNRQVAERMLAERKAGGAMQEILGRATGAGVGKALTADIAVQQRDAQGNVTRESLVRTPEEADTLAEQFDQPGREGVIISAAQAIRRRAQRIREEGRQAQAQQEIKQTRRAASDIIEKELGDTELAERTKRKLGRKTISENEAARRLVGYAARLRRRELRKRIGDVDVPDVLDFGDLKTAAQYKELFGQYRDAEIAERMATTAENKMRSRAQRESFRRQIGALRRLKKATTESERVAAVARKVSQEEVQKIEREAREAATRRPSDEGSIFGGATRTALERVTSEQLKQLSDSEINLLFLEAANIATGSRVQRTATGPGTGGAQTREAGATTLFNPHGKTLEEVIAAHPTRSERTKLIERVKSLLERREHGGKAKTHSITAAGGERQTAGGGKVAVQRAQLRPMQAFETAPPREMSAAERTKHNARVRKAYHELEGTVGDIKQSMFKVIGPEMARVVNTREENGNPPLQSRRAVYARAYLRNLYRYGQLLQQLRPRSRGGLKEVEDFNKRMKSLLSAPKEKFLDRLSNALDAEIGIQAQRVAKIDPKKLATLTSRKARILTAKAYNAKVEDQLKWTQRLHEKWHTNSLFNENVAPLMQKLIGYVTRDSELWSYSSERRGLGKAPTLEEMEKLKFAMRRFRGTKTAREDLLKPLKRFFEEFGFKFDGPDLVIPMKDGKFDYDNELELLRKYRDKTAYRYELTPAEREAEAARKKANADRIAAENQEIARRAQLTPRQRAAEDRAKARKAETARRKPMTYEQRKALESLDRRERLKLELLDLQADLPSMREAAQSVAAVLEEQNVGKLTSLLKLASGKLGADNPYQAIIQRLVDLNMDDVLVGWDRGGEKVGKAYGTFNTKTLADGRRVREIHLSRALFEATRARGGDPSPAFIHSLVHEAVHAATAGAIANNPRARAAMWAIMRQARTSAIEQRISLISGEREFYGFRDNSIDEFVAEAFSNPVFQGKLREIKIEQRSVWQVILDVVKRLLGIESMPRAESVLDAVLATSDQLLTGELQHSTRGTEIARSLNIDADAVRENIANVYDKAVQSSRITKDVHNRAANILARNKEAGTRALLSALSMEQIGQFYNRSFGGGGGPLSEYMKAFFERNADNSANMESADRLSRAWTALTEKVGVEKAVELSRIMTEATLYGIHPDVALTSELNKSVTSAAQKQRHAELAARYKALDPELKQHYAAVRDYYERTLRDEVNLVTLNALRAALTKGVDAPMEEKDFKYTVNDVRKLNTVQALQAEFGDQLPETTLKTIARIASIPTNRVGPYFPLMRFGDYVVTASKVRERKYFDDRKDALAWAAEQRAEDPTLSVSSPMDDGEGFAVTVTEKEVRMAESPTEAEENRNEMMAQYGAENVSQVQLKAQLYSRGATISSNSALGTILDKLKDNPAAQAAIKDFYLRSLSDSAFRKREIRRANRRGVDYDLQHRTFANYAKASAYYTSQLKYGWRLADGLIAMQKYVEKVANGEAQSNISPVRMGEVVREIDTRDKMTTDPMEVSKWVRRGTALSQFMMLTSPSYWMINATQPWMVTLPWLSARTSVGEASAALANAQKLIASPILNQMGKSWLGAKALTSKTAAEQAFTVLEQVEQYIQQRAGDKAPEYINMLHKLKRESIIDLSFVAELRDIAEGQSTTLSQKVLDASRIMSHLTEVNNRILTALAAFDLYRSKGMSIEAAEGFAKQAVSLTQFNYSSGNTPRLFQARGPLGQLGPLVFQFMKYPQHMYALLIDNFRRAVASGGIDRQIALKTLAGLFATHLAAGGIIGAMLQPVKWAIGLALAAFGSDDEPYTITNALSGETFDRLIREAAADLFGTDAGEVISAGLPRAAGVDVSTRMSLGSLYFIDLKTDTAESTLGSLVSSFGGPLVNLGTGFWKGAQYMSEGQLSKGMEAFLPKGAKDIVKSIRYTNDGLTDGTGKEILDAKKFSPWELFLQSIGFTPSMVSERYAGNAAIKDRKTYDEGRRKLLMQRFNNASHEERAAIVREITEFNRANPAQAISRSQLLRSAKSFREREGRVKRFGADLSKREMIYEEEGAPYND